MSVPGLAAIRFYTAGTPPSSSAFNNSTNPPCVMDSTGLFWQLIGTTITQITVGGTSAAVAWGSITGTLSNQTDLQTELNKKFNTSDAGTAATTASSTYAFATSIGTVASTFASTWAFADHRHDASHVTSGVFNTTRLASTGTASNTAFLRGDLVWAGLDAGLVTSGVFATGRLASSGTAQSTTFLAGDQTWKHPALSSFFTQMGATVTIGAAFSTAISTTLSAGTWQVNGMMLIGRDTVTTSIQSFTARFNDGTNNHASGQHVNPASASSSYGTIALSSRIVLGAASTISFQGAAQVTSCSIRAQAWQNAAGSTATQMVCTRIA